MKRLLSILLCVTFYSCALAGSTPQTKVTVAEYLNEDGSTHFVINFNDQFDKNSALVTTVAIDRAKAGDTILININSGGGQLGALSDILHSMKQTPAEISCHLGDWVASAAAIMAWNCPTITADERSLVLYHKAAMGVMPLITADRLTSNVLDKYSRSLKNTDQVILTLYLRGAMKDGELMSYKQGLDVIIGGLEVVDRHSKLHGYTVQSDPQEDIDKATRPERHTVPNRSK